MSAEGSLRRPERAAGPCENEPGSNSETEGIPEWSLNVQTYQLLQEGLCTYNAKEQSLVWPPMLLISGEVDPSHTQIDKDLHLTRHLLAFEGVQANSVVETKHVCCEGNKSFHLSVLPPSSVSFAAAKAIDSAHGLHFHIFYPSLKDMIDIKNGLIPEFSRRIFEGLKYHGRPRQAWNDLAVELLRDDGICVGLGRCQKYDAMDCVDEELLGEFHVGVQVLEVWDDLLPSHWRGSLRRWRTTHVLNGGVSLFECLRQHMQDESEDFYYDVDLDSAPIERAKAVLRDQSISSVAPSFGLCKNLNVNSDHLSATCSNTCQDAIFTIEENTVKSDSGAPRLYDGKSFATKYESDESLRKVDVEVIINDISKERSLLERLGTTNSVDLVKDVIKRLTILQELTDPGCSSTTISSMIRGAEKRELITLESIGENVKREKRNKMGIAGFGSEIETFILQRRKEQHKKLLEEVANIKAKHVSTLDAFVLDKFKFVDDIRKIGKETEGIHEWLLHYTAKATDKEKQKWEEQVAEDHFKELMKWEEEVSKARNEGKEKLEDQVVKARTIMNEAREMMTELAIARQQLAFQKEAMPKCAICFEGLERTIKCGKKRDRNVVQRKRACFTPCMHSSMCLDCAVAAWERFKRCPVCNIPCSSKPQPIFM